MIRVLVVDDSAVVRAYVRDALHTDPEVQVVGEAGDGREAVTLTERLSPDLITMDVNMPVMGGLEAVSEIMARKPTPILVLTASLGRRVADLSFRAIHAGALDVLQKPQVYSREDFRRIAKDLVERVKLLSRIRVISHPRSPRKKTRRLAKGELGERRRVVAIGASLGGPSAVLSVLQGLPPNFPSPILLVQHIAEGFTDSFGTWLAKESPLPVEVARDGAPVEAGKVFLSPATRHMVFEGGRVRLVDGEPRNACRPSIDVLFESVAREAGEEAISVLLTGMGADGAEGSRAVKSRRGYTIAQDQATCVVFGMPKVAIELGVIDAVLPIHEVARELVRMVAPPAAKKK
ncbi:MAG: chemotaxis response regulator protein-glutamate methylesterase [Planctomycetales bacterium]|nr:chemotaxis response regulator protein-glutamate methylesterase [Planctomycetales bacterium]